jgi:hypothetical protein
MIGAGQPILEHLDAALDVRLLLLGGVVFGVLAQVMIAGGGVSCMFFDADGLEALELALDRPAPAGHRDPAACHRRPVLGMNAAGPGPAAGFDDCSRHRAVKRNRQENDLIVDADVDAHGNPR